MRGHAGSIVFAGHYAYVSGYNDDLVKVFDIADPYNVTAVGVTQGT